MRWLLAVMQRDLRLVGRRPIDAGLPLVFLLVTSALFPLGVGPAPDTLRTIAPGVVWVCALLATLLSLPTLYATDHADGALEQMALVPQPLVLLVLGKALAHWLTQGLPLVLAAPLLGLMFDLSMPSLAMLLLTLALGTPMLSLLGGLGAALTLGVRGAGLITLVIVLPLAVPALIFGAGAVAQAEAGLSASGQLSLLGALAIATAMGAPWATAAALRIALDA